MNTLTSKKSQPDAQTKGGIRQMALTDLYALARTVLYATVRTPMMAEFHGAVCDFRAATPYQRNLYLLSRDHLKTSLLTVAGNVQRILRDPQIRILLASNKADSAEGQLREIKGHLMHPLLLWAFPEILWTDPYKDAEEWTTQAISVKRKHITKEATIETIGAEGAVTGKHYDHGSFDDLMDEQNSRTRDQIEKVIRWYETTQSLFEPHATQEIIGTPWDFKDLYAWLIEQKLKREFKLGVYRQPCWQVKEPGVLRIGTRGEIVPDDFVLDAAGFPLPVYPLKHSRESLQERQRFDGRSFASQWLLRPVDDESALFPRSGAIIRSRTKLPDPSTLWCVMAVDPAISTKEWADFSAVVMVGFDPDGMAYALDIRRGKWSPTELVNHVYEMYAQTPNVRSVGIESVGFQKLYFREFHRAAEDRGIFLPLIKLERDNRVGKSVRIRSLEPLWRAGQLILSDACENLDDFLEEAERFRPWGAAHDDMLDAMADCLQLRVRPHAPAGMEGLDEWDTERLQFERECQQQEPSMDRVSLKNAWSMKRRRDAWQEARDAETLELGNVNEFYG